MDFAVNALVIVVLQPLVIDRLTQLPRFPTVAAAQLILGHGFGAIAFAHTLRGYALTLGVATLGDIGDHGVAAAVVADLAPPHLRGRYYRIFGLAYGGPASGIVFAGCAIAGVAMCIGQLLLSPGMRRRTALARPQPSPSWFANRSST